MSDRDCDRKGSQREKKRIELKPFLARECWKVLVDFVHRRSGCKDGLNVGMAAHPRNITLRAAAFGLQEQRTGNTFFYAQDDTRWTGQTLASAGARRFRRH